MSNTPQRDMTRDELLAENARLRELSEARRKATRYRPCGTTRWRADLAARFLAAHIAGSAAVPDAAWHDLDGLIAWSFDVAELFSNELARREARKEGF